MPYKLWKLQDVLVKSSVKNNTASLGHINQARELLTQRIHTKKMIVTGKRSLILC